MTIETARAFLLEAAPDRTIIEHPHSTATVQEAAATLAVEPGRIAKTLALRMGTDTILLVTRGDARLDNAKLKKALGGRTRMLSPVEAQALTGHPVGGICPFGVPGSFAIRCDVSLLAFDTVFPAAGSPVASIEIAPGRLAEITNAVWVDATSMG